eukprot:m.311248 g.311248  ORF g.311248 m.311248 type:complete len:286 (+) comp63215_c0_seq1:127-984(+)
MWRSSFFLRAHSAARVFICSRRYVHEEALTGFGAKTADQYERARPQYTSEAVSQLLENVGLQASGGRVLELAAGTGKFTRPLLSALQGKNAKLTTSEPSEAFRGILEGILGSTGVEVIACTAENIPFSDSSLDLVIAAQSFHWFANVKALGEIHRVLKPGCHFAMIWNTIDTSFGWVEAIEDLIGTHYTGDTPRYVSGKWSDAFKEFDGFGPLQHLSRRDVKQEGPKELIVDRVLSISVMANQSDKERQKVAADVENILMTYPETKEVSAYCLPYVTDIYWGKKV